MLKYNEEIAGNEEIHKLFTGSGEILTGSEGIQHNGGRVNRAVVVNIKHSQ